MTKTSTSPSGRALGTVDEFFAWWGSELGRIAPTFLRPKKKLLIAIPTDTGLQLEMRRGRRRKLQGLLNDIQPPMKRRLQRAIKERALEVVLAAPSKGVIHQTLALPLSAEADLDGVIRFEIDRVTPFKARELYYTYRVLDRRFAADGFDADGRRKGTVDVGLTFAPKQGLDPHLQALAAAKLPADRIDVFASDQVDPELLGLDISPPKPIPRRRRKLFGAVLLAALVVLTGVWISFEIDYRERRVEVLRDETFMARRRAIETQERSSAAAAYVDPAVYAFQKKTSEPLMVGVLAALADALPDSAWLETLELEGLNVEMSGAARDAAALIAVFERHPLFAEPSFRAPITRDAENDVERFAMSLRVDLTTYGDAWPTAARLETDVRREDVAEGAELQENGMQRQ